MAKKKLKRRKPKPNPEPEAKRGSRKSVSKGKVTQMHPENSNWFPKSESVAASKEFKKIKGNLTKTRKISGG